MRYFKGKQFKKDIILVAVFFKNLFRIYGIICTKKDIFYDT
ncbi:hypothetical protein Q0N88_31745 [Bacillus thuringiensis]